SVGPYDPGPGRLTAQCSSGYRMSTASWPWAGTNDTAYPLPRRPYISREGGDGRGPNLEAPHFRLTQLVKRTGPGGFSSPETAPNPSRRGRTRHLVFLSGPRGGGRSGGPFFGFCPRAGFGDGSTGERARGGGGARGGALQSLPAGGLGSARHLPVRVAGHAGDRIPCSR